MLTDTGGNEIRRVSRAAVRRVMTNPVNVTADGPCCHAMCFDEASGGLILLDGAGFIVAIRDDDYGHYERSQLDYAITDFLEIVGL
jgi:hypothetical protein